MADTTIDLRIDDTVRAAAAAFDIRKLDKAFLDDPYPIYHALRERDPVMWLPDGSVFLTAHADLLQVYQDTEVFRSEKTIDFKPTMGDTSLYEHHTTSLVFNDPPAHTRVRSLLQPAFTPRALRSLRPGVEALVDRLLDNAEDLGSFDMIEDVAMAVPIQLIGDMLGVPEDERGPLRGWSLDILSGLEPVLTPEQLDRGVTAVDEFKDYLKGLIAHRAAHPVDTGIGAILSMLIEGDRESGEKLTELELLHNCIFLLNAGHETTTNLIGNGTEALLRHPDQLQRLRDDPELIVSAVEEFLRFESSNQLGNRRAVAAAQIGGKDIPAGTYIHLCIGAANRDPDEFPDPDRLDLGRKPNRHLAFGAGIHACAGMSLARMEGQVAIGKLVQRFPKLRADGPPERGGRARFRGFNRLPVSVS